MGAVGLVYRFVVGLMRLAAGLVFGCPGFIYRLGCAAQPVGVGGMFLNIHSRKILGDLLRRISERLQ